MDPGGLVGEKGCERNSDTVRIREVLKGERELVKQRDAREKRKQSWGIYQRFFLCDL